MTKHKKPISIANVTLWVLFAALSLVLLFHLFSFSDFSHRLFSHRVQNVVIHLDDQLQQAKANLQEDITTLEEQNVPLYAFRHDTLVYWNTNLVEPKLLRKRFTTQNDTILNLSCGDFLLSTLTQDGYNVYLLSLLNTTYPIENEYFINKFQPILGKHHIEFLPEYVEDAFPLYSRSGQLLSYFTIQYPSLWGSNNRAFLLGCLLLMGLCLYLLVFRALLRKIGPDDETTTDKRRFLFTLLAFAGAVLLTVLGFMKLFRYGFHHGFFIPSAIQLDSCFVLLVVGLIVVSTVMFVLHRFFRRYSLRTATIRQWSEVFVMLIQFVLCGLLLTLVYNSEYTKYENHEIESLAQTLSDEHDLHFEQAYHQFVEAAKADTTFQAMLASNDIMEEVIADYIRNFLLDSVMDRYQLSVTLCGPSQELDLQPYGVVADCGLFFKDKIRDNHGEKVDSTLYFMDYNSLDPSYLAIWDDTLLKKNVYLEFSKPVTPVGFGLPRVLLNDPTAFPLNYSVACYRDTVLIYKYGSYVYPNYLHDYKYNEDGFHYGKRLKHYTYRDDNAKTLAISLERRGLMAVTTPFVVFFFLMLVLYLLVYFLGGLRRSHVAKNTLSRRFQMLLMLALGASFLVVGPVSVIFLRGLYHQKANDYHYERSRTLLLDITGEVDFSFLKRPGFKNMLDQIVRHYSETFFTDINIYSVEGKLLASTSPELFDLHIQSSLMDAEAYHNMQGGKSLYFIHEERLGQAVYQSAYIAIQDQTGATLAFLNTPYFTSEQELRSEILNYVLTYINIILLIIFVILPIVLAFTNKITNPLMRLQEKMKRIDINTSNEKLEWKSSDDEIGALIKQYNLLLAELEKSANELRRTTAESTWRGVARQVAHEIHNSLTPMRLSVQMLQHSAQQGVGDNDERIQRTTTTLLEQIDALSDIASSFSEYAKMPVNNPQPLNLAELVGNVVNLYDNIDNIHFSYDCEEGPDYTFMGDKTNLNSAIGNIIKNATQAIGPKEDGRIAVRLRTQDKKFVLSVKDNGKGIKEEYKRLIFLPNFTTKSGGSGVGLSLTYNIVRSAGGNIEFESGEGEGSEFVITLPM